MPSSMSWVIINIVLSDEGFALADEMVVSHVETEERMLSALTDAERDQLRALLTKIGTLTVPVLWDKKTKMIVNNESSEIIRMFNSAFDQITGNALDFYPQELRAEIDAANERLYANVNNGVYRAGFATTQKAYESAYDALFETLDDLDARLETQQYLVGEQITEADWRLFTTLIRFDAVYHSHFKVNLRRIEDYPNLSEYVRELYQVPSVSKTVSFYHIKQHYYVSQRTINPTQVVPKGPVLDFDRSHERGRLSRPTKA
ncbi:MAG: hypothetical protein HN377_08355 [Alphaproteobacteria bacterium]|nr:hypothetical protein [Alphaproteobacteria bacterium]MBT7943153.1 hypothetical protein [Alphaproteobacteria bacterium]